MDGILKDSLMEILRLGKHASVYDAKWIAVQALHIVYENAEGSSLKEVAGADGDAMNHGPRED